MKPRALIRLFNLVVSYDTEQPDILLEQEAQLLVAEINRILKENLPGPIPQLSFEDMKKKIKIGVKNYKASEIGFDDSE